MIRVTNIDQLLFHGVGAGILTERQAAVAKKIYNGQRLTETGIPGLLRLDDRTPVTTEDVQAFDGDLLPILLAGRKA